MLAISKHFLNCKYKASFSFHDKTDMQRLSVWSSVGSLKTPTVWCTGAGAVAWVLGQVLGHKVPCLRAEVTELTPQLQIAVWNRGKEGWNVSLVTGKAKKDQKHSRKGVHYQGGGRLCRGTRLVFIRGA